MVCHLHPCLKLRGCTGRSFRAPSFTELYYQDPANLGDSLLQPEHTWEHEIGTDWFSKFFSSQFSVYYRKTEGDIDWVRKTGETVWRTQNIGMTRCYGSDAALNLYPYLWLSYKLALSYVHIRDGLPSEYTSKYVCQVPEIIFHSGMIFFSTIHVNARWLSFGRSTPLGSQILVDCSIDRKFELSAKISASLALMFNNLLDGKYEDYQGVPLPGRSLRAIVSLSKI